MRRISPALYFFITFAALSLFSGIAIAEASFEPFAGRVIQNAKMRAGPGTEFETIAVLPAGTVVQVVGCNATCDWYNLDSGGWTAAFLIDCIDSVDAAVQQPAFPAGLAPVQVLSIKNGETIRVRLEGGIEANVRYIGVNAPERGVAMYEDAGAFNAQLVEGETVYLERDVSEVDGEGRLLRYVWLADGRMVNEEMIAAGFAAASTNAADVKYQSRLLAAEQSARAERRNWWSFFPRPPA